MKAKYEAFVNSRLGSTIILLVSVILFCIIIVSPNCFNSFIRAAFFLPGLLVLFINAGCYLDGSYQVVEIVYPKTNIYFHYFGLLIIAIGLILLAIQSFTGITF